MKKLRNKIEAKAPPIDPNAQTLAINYSYSNTPLNRIFSNSGVKIGKFCSISWDVDIAPTEHDMHGLTSSHIGGVFVAETPNLEEKVDHVVVEETNYLNMQYGFDLKEATEEIFKETIIGNDVWIGCGAKIKCGVKVGDGAVIGMGAMVTKDVEPYSIVGGNPAKIIRYRFNEETIKELLDIQWWNFPKEVLAKLPIENVGKCIELLKIEREKYEN